MITPQIDTNLDNINQEDVATLPNRTYKITQTTSVSSESEYKYTEFEGKQIEAQTVNHNMKDFVIKGDTFQQTYTGKNSLPLSISGNNTRGLTVTANKQTGEITYSGTVTTNYPWLIDSTSEQLTINLEAGTYTFSIDNPLGYSITLRFYNSSNQYPTSVSITAGETSKTATIDYTCTKIVILLSRSVNDVVPQTTLKLMLEKNSTATSFEPFVGGTEAPNPNFPQPIKVVTGSQTIQVGNTTKQLDLGSLELCKIGDYRDYIYKENGNWYKYEKIRKILCDGQESWTKNNSYTGVYYHSYGSNSFIVNAGLSNYYPYHSGYSNYDYAVYTNASSVVFKNKDINTTANDFQAWLQSHPVTVYAVRKTEIVAQITDTTLVNQLENILDTNMNNGTTIIYADNEEGLQPTLKMKLPTERIIHSETTTEDRIIGKTDGLDAIKQAILHILMTERYANIIYDENYGVELEQYIGADLDYIQATIENTLKDALTYDLRIRDVVVDNIEKIDNDKVTVNFTATTIYGDLEMEVNVNV